MGTRNLTIVKMNGKVKIAQYCQWDGYPTGQGETISKFIRNTLKLREFKKQVSRLKFTTDDHVDAMYNNAIAAKEDFKESYPAFHRDTGADILQLVQKGKVDLVVNSIDFLKDGLFCEYAYEIDLDKKTVAVYTGGKKPYKTYTFKAFANKTAMKKLEQQLQDE